MNHHHLPAARDPLALRVHLLGQIDVATCHNLQQRLVYEAGEPDGPALSLLLCEHNPVITVGRQGSRAHLRLARRELVARGIDVVWVNRGGGCIFHAPGQLAIYPIVSLSRVGWTVGQFVERAADAVQQALYRLGFGTWRRSGQYGCWGRTGLLAACGMAVQHQVSCHGFFVNVHPPMHVTRLVDTVYGPPVERDPRRSMSCLLSEHGNPIRMPRVRSAVIDAFAAALERPRFHLQTGHVYLASCRDTTVRAS